MTINKRPIKYKKERVVLSDILPYEIPVTFSNRYLYDFLVTNRIEIINGKITWNKNDSVIGEIIKLLFEFNNKTITNNSITFDKRKELRTIPFNYKITHKESDFREFTIIHPKNQLAVIEFYNKYKELILYYCGVSSFSIRRPYKISQFVYYKDKTHYDTLAKDPGLEFVEEYNKEYETLKTFFVYKDYSNIYKFYESYKYHRCEKKYNKLYKFDISKCFDSIYTHLVSWALLNKDIVKEKIPESNQTFSGKFDALMRNLNYGETSGIVIGPEFSRIFAELVLQNVDNKVAKALKEKKCIHKTDYEVFRYVDDYFVFYNKDEDRDKIIQTFRLQLKEYKLYINDLKALLYEKPIITEITIAKQRITELLNKYLSYKFQSRKDAKESLNTESVSDDDLERKGSLYVSSNKLITKFKTIIKETGIDYKDILNYTLAVIERKISKIVKDYHLITDKKSSQKNFIKAILEILDFTFFLYAVSPRVNTTIKLCRILRIQTEFLKMKEYVNSDFKHLVFKKIYDNIYFILQKNKSLEHSQVETLYLLIALGELGKDYWLNVDVLCSYFDIKRDQRGELCTEKSLNYFSIVVLLFYIKHKKRYNKVRAFLQMHIRKKYDKIDKNNVGKKTELVLLLFDILACPYLEDSFKNDLLIVHGVTDAQIQNSIIKRRKYWFTKWTNFDFGKELDAKKSREVY